MLGYIYTHIYRDLFTYINTCVDLHTYIDVYIYMYTTRSRCIYVSTFVLVYSCLSPWACRWISVGCCERASSVDAIVPKVGWPATSAFIASFRGDCVAAFGPDVVVVRSPRRAPASAGHRDDLGRLLTDESAVLLAAAFFVRVRTQTAASHDRPNARCN